jgi:hypothetical protein
MRTIEVNGEKITLCVNAFAGERAWYCYHYAGRPTAGKLAVDEAGRCEACALATSDNLPSFMENEE